MIKTLHSRCRGHVFDPGSGKIPHTVWHSQKKECILKKKIYLFLALLGLCCCADFSLVAEWGLLFIVLHRLLIAVTLFVAEHRLEGTQLQQLRYVGSIVMPGSRAQTP